MSTKPPVSKLAIAFYIVGLVWLASGLFALDTYSQLGDSQGAFAIVSLVPAMIGAILTSLFGLVVQMIADIKWKLFEVNQDA